MIGRVILATAGAATLIGATVGTTSEAAAAAAANCKPREDIVKVLSSKYQESRRAYGLSNQMQMLELYASENGTWTAVDTTPDGKSCIVAAGEAWTEQQAIPAGQPVGYTH
jgi:hypothetical protein